MTLATVGYGDLVPRTPVSKVFTIIYLLTGVGVFVGLVGKLAASLIWQPPPPPPPATDETGSGRSHRRDH